MSEAPKLKPCPFCGDPMGFSLSELIVHTTRRPKGCPIADQGWPTEFADRWNTRTDAITPQMAAKVLLEAQNLDGMTLLPNYVRAMLRTISGEE